MTPSKSKTIARNMKVKSQNEEVKRTLSLCVLPFQFSLFEPFAGADWNLQTVFGRWIGAFVAGVVIAIRMVRAVEVQLVDPGGGPIEIDVAARWIGLRAARQIVEWHE